MNTRLKLWFKPSNRKRLILTITSIALLFLLLVGGTLFAINPLFRERVLSPFGVTPDTPADPHIYVINHQEYSFDSQAYLNSIDPKTGKLEHTIALHTTSETVYHKVLNGISYEIARYNKTATNGSAIGGGDTILLATRLSDGHTLWNDVWNDSLVSVFEDSNTLYIQLAKQLTAINVQNGSLIWSYRLQSRANITFDDNHFFVQDNDSRIVALRADNGKTVWSHKFSSTSNDHLGSLAADGDHVFFAQLSDQQPAKISELDANTGASLWQKDLNAGDLYAYLRIENHHLLIETKDTFESKAHHKLYVLQTSDNSITWSYGFQSSNTAPSQSDRWIYTDDIVYSLSTEIAQQTFATNLVMRAWQISDGKKLFQTNIGMTGDYRVARVQDKLIFSAAFLGATDNKATNDLEVRQAQTGKLLWHKHIGDTPGVNDYGWDLSVLKPQEMTTNSEGYTTYYLPANDGSDASILYVAMNKGNRESEMLYALKAEDGHMLWQINPNALNHNQGQHPTLSTSAVNNAVAQVGEIREFALSTSGSFPTSITVGPDGNLWFVELNQDKIGRMSPTGKVTEFALAKPDGKTNSIFAITAGPDGNLWFTEANSDKIGRITPNGTISEFALPIPDAWPAFITAGPDGNLWFTEFNSDKIGRITPNGTISEFALPIDSQPNGIAAGSDGNLWFVELSQNKIGRISPLGAITEFAVPTSDAWPTYITAGPDGNLWFTEFNSNKIGRITPKGKISEFSVPHIPNADDSPIAIAAGSDGNLWFTYGNQIGRIAPNATATGPYAEFVLPTPDSKPNGIITGPDGNLWFTEGKGNKIGRITSGK